MPGVGGFQARLGLAATPAPHGPGWSHCPEEKAGCCAASSDACPQGGEADEAPIGRTRPRRPSAPPEASAWAPGSRAPWPSTHRRSWCRALYDSTISDRRRSRRPPKEPRRRRCRFSSRERGPCRCPRLSPGRPGAAPRPERSPRPRERPPHISYLVVRPWRRVTRTSGLYPPGPGLRTAARAPVGIGLLPLPVLGVWLEQLGGGRCAHFEVRAVNAGGRRAPRETVLVGLAYRAVGTCMRRWEARGRAGCGR